MSPEPEQKLEPHGRSFFKGSIPPHWIRMALLVVVYSVSSLVSCVLSFELRFDFDVPEQWKDARIGSLLWFLPTKIFFLQLMGQFRGLLSYFRIPDLIRLVVALGLSSGMLLLANYSFIAEHRVPRGVILADFVISVILLAGFRVGLRMYREKHLTFSKGSKRRVRRVAILGAGDVGSTVAADMLARSTLAMKPVLFLDDNPRKWEIDIHGVPVLGSPDRLAVFKEKYDLHTVIIAMPTASQKRIKELIALSKECGLEPELVPTLDDITSGRVKASRVRPVEIEDLLGREPVALDSSAIRELILGKHVLVTGAGGSIGSELCRQIMRHSPGRLVLVEQCEVQLFEVEQMLISEGGGSVICPEIGDVLDGSRMRSLLETHRPELVLHAAAHKHVSLMERQPSEAIKNNIMGTALMADIARETGVKNFVLISTDKAINPTSVMGTTKRVSELILQASQQIPGHTTRFSAVRFGNVLGSSGSVIPIFRKQIAAGGPVKVTHPEVTRYFMTIREAAGLVLQCAVQSQGGEIFVLEMGQSVKIVDLARQMIELSGYTPDVDIAVEFIGLRPGEKLYEELQHTGEEYAPTAHPGIRRFVATPPTAESAQAMRRELAALVAKGADTQELKRALKRFVPEYTPYWD